MAEVKIPKLGENVDGAEVAAVLVSVGDTVEKDQSLLELESDKATVEVPSPFAGKVTHLAVSAGDEVSAGQVVMHIESADQNSEDSADKDAPPKATTDKEAPQADEPPTSAEPEETPAETGSGTSELKEVEIPKLGENIDGAEVAAVLVSVGDTVEKDQSLLELESDKATVEVPSPFAGVLESINIEAGQEVKSGQVVMTLKTNSDQGGTSKPKAQPQKEAQKEAPEKPKAAAPKPEPQGVSEPHDTPASLQSDSEDAPSLGNPAPAAPSVRRFARELGVKIEQVQGSGPRGRISKDDVKAHVKQRMQAPVSSVGTTSAPAQELPDFSKWGEIRTEKLSNIRKATAQQMATAWNTIPHVTQFDDADITEIEVFRKGKGAKLAGTKLTVTAILLKITALALKRFPKFNSSLDLANQQMVFKDYVHVGVAVDTPKGLLVPVLRNADQKGIAKLSEELGEMAAKARDRKLGIDDMQGGTFTISNLGGLGTTYFTPIVNWPQVAILGVGRAKQTPVWQEGEFVPRLIMPLSISYDHRIIDGADAARFLRWICMALEDPMIALMEGNNND